MNDKWILELPYDDLIDLIKTDHIKKCKFLYFKRGKNHYDWKIIKNGVVKGILYYCTISRRGIIF